MNDKFEVSQKEKITAARIKLKEFKNRNIPYIQSTLIKISEINQENSISNSFDSNKKLNLPPKIDTNLGFEEIREQLKLHIQTIGLLVAEKTELQSKLNQQIRKCDKQQDECNELIGRLKASRKKNSELEKIVQKLESDKIIEETSEDKKSDFEKINYSEKVTQVKELNQKLEMKNQESLELIQLVSKLKNQIEILHGNRKINDQHEKLQAENSMYELAQSFSQQREVIKSEYQSYVDSMQNQIDNLVDQINKLVDEREGLFTKIDSLQAEIKKLKHEKTNSNLFDNEKCETNSKIELLENEIKYFKQQIEILLKEKNNLQSLVDHKTKEIDDLNSNSSKTEVERVNLNNLIEESHNNKQTISRILKQNNELKINLQTLQQENLLMKNRLIKFDNYIDAIAIEKQKFLSKKVDDNEEFSKSIDLNFNYNEANQFDKIDSEKNSEMNYDFLFLFNSQLLTFEGETPSIEKLIDYFKNMKLVEKKFINIMEENAQLKEKNNELEHIIKQLEFETDTIIDYITMYQIERGKLNEKYKIKEDTIENMSSFLNIYHLAFLEVDNLIDTLISLQNERKIKNYENNDEIDQRIHFILITIKNIVLELNQSFLLKSKLYFSKEISRKKSVLSLNQKYEKLDIENNVAKFKTETIICSYCYGDLFIV